MTILDYLRQLSQTILDNHPQLSQTILDYLRQLSSTILDYLRQLSLTILDYLSLSQTTTLNYLRLSWTILDNYPRLSQTILDYLSQLSLTILDNYKNNYHTGTTTVNKSMGFDPSAIQSCYSYFCIGNMLSNCLTFMVWLLCNFWSKYFELFLGGRPLSPPRRGAPRKNDAP